jgi:hydrogenase expression/formation protein HypD
MVKEEGNISAQKIISQVFDVSDQAWRGIGTIEESGYRLNKAYIRFDADKKFSIDIIKAEENKECIAGDIMKGLKKPYQCVHFGKTCTPQNPLGAPMVSSEGACAAYYNFSTMFKTIS